VIFYESRKLNENERNYATHDLELATIVHALKMCRHYLLERNISLMLDHGGFRYLFDQPKLNARQFICLALIIELDFEIKYIMGKENKVGDALNKSLQVVHLETMRICEFNINKNIMEALIQDENFQHEKTFL